MPSVATVQLADVDDFRELDRVTSPQTVVHKHWWPRRDSYGGGAVDQGGAGGLNAPAVQELSRQRLGPFDVTVLDAKDASALTTWLTQRSYQISPNLAEGVRPYVEKGWKYVAVRLVPEAARGRLGGSLDPLWVSFPTSEPVYPMRLSATARRRQTVRLFLLGEHRMTRTDALSSKVPSQVRFAGRAGPQDNPALAPLLGNGAYLTELASYVPQPAALTEDFRFSSASNDAPYRRVLYRNELVTVLGVPVAPAGTALAVVLAAVVLALTCVAGTAAEPPYGAAHELFTGS